MPDLSAMTITLEASYRAIVAWAMSPGSFAELKRLDRRFRRLDRVRRKYPKRKRGM